MQQTADNQKMRLPFTKMHGLGNDFMVIDCVSQPHSLSTEQIALYADRQLGIGFDQLLQIEPATRPAMPTFATAFSIATAARWSTAAMARAASPNMYTTRA